MKKAKSLLHLSGVLIWIAGVFIYTAAASRWTVFLSTYFSGVNAEEALEEMARRPIPTDLTALFSAGVLISLLAIEGFVFRRELHRFLVVFSIAGIVAFGVTAAFNAIAWLDSAVISGSLSRLMPGLVAGFVVLCAGSVSYLFYRVLALAMRLERTASAVPLYSGVMWINAAAMLLAVQLPLIVWLRQ